MAGGMLHIPDMIKVHEPHPSRTCVREDPRTFSSRRGSLAGVSFVQEEDKFVSKQVKTGRDVALLLPPYVGPISMSLHIPGVIKMRKRKTWFPERGEATHLGRGVAAAGMECSREPGTDSRGENPGGMRRLLACVCVSGSLVYIRISLLPLTCRDVPTTWMLGVGAGVELRQGLAQLYTTQWAAPLNGAVFTLLPGGEFKGLHIITVRLGQTGL
ncbi:hypothetical protein Bbelb_030340 [Branchiostoma belcheri]|nr:hypothetical protein Bbelb_030340 [Branchiostoma belcheri]